MGRFRGGRLSAAVRKKRTIIVLGYGQTLPGRLVDNISKSVDIETTYRSNRWRIAVSVLLLHSQLPWGGADGVLARLREQDVIHVPVVAIRAACEAPRYSQLNSYPILRSLSGNCAVSELVGAVRYAASFNLSRLLHV